MRVRNMMSAPAATVTPGDTLHVADGTMSLGGVRHLPVVKGRKLVGVISQKDILRAPGLLGPSVGFAVDTRTLLRALRVEDVMSSTIVTIGADATVREAAERLLDHRVGCLPVLELGTLVGIVTTSDVLRAVAGSSTKRDDEGPETMTRSTAESVQLAEVGA